VDKENFDKRLFITYLDETTVYSLSDVIFNAVVSMTASKENYIKNIEKN